MDDVETHLRKLLGPELSEILSQRDGSAVLLKKLPRRFSPKQIAVAGDAQRVWELLGLHYRNQERFHEALDVNDALHRHILRRSSKASRAMAGMPLVWSSDLYYVLNFPCHGKRYLMLTLCEDAVGGMGRVDPERTGTYFRAVWHHGLTDRQVQDYGRRAWEVAQTDRDASRHAEWILQHLDQDWMTEIPTAAELTHYRCNGSFVEYLLRRLGSGDGRNLERVGAYLLGCLPGVRVQMRKPSDTTEYDLICSMEGPSVDFREELGRVIVCEAKDWKKPVSFESFAKFSRILDSTKSKFGILFSRRGISGSKTDKFAAREQRNLFHDRGVVVVVLTEQDLHDVAQGKSLVSLLRARYEQVRLELPK